MISSDECWRMAKRCMERATICEIPRMKVYWEQMVERWTRYAEEAEAQEQKNGVPGREAELLSSPSQ
jgi:hypothetical protein